MAEVMQRRMTTGSFISQSVRHRNVAASLLPHAACGLADSRIVGREALLSGRHSVAGASVLHSHHAARLPPCAALATAAPAIPGVESGLTVQCKVVVPYHATHHGQQLVLVGSCEQLGNWDVKKGVKFTWCEGHTHVADVELPIHSSIACKLVVLGENQSAAWEPEANRELLLAPSSLASRAAGYTVLCHWGFPDCTQVVANALRRGNVSPNGSYPAAIGNSRPANGHHFGSAGDNPIIAGVKKALVQASSKVIPGIASWDDDTAEEEAALVQCQVTVMVPRSGPKLKPEQSLVLVGSSPALGRWDPAAGLPLERMGEESAMWTAHVELPLGEGLQAKVVVVDGVSGEALTWEPCENRPLARHRGPKPVMITAYWGVPATHSLEVDRLSGAAAASSPQVVQLLRQQLAATSSQLEGLRKERDDARKTIAANEEHVKNLEIEAKRPDITTTPSQSLDKSSSRFEMVQLAEQLQTTRRLYEVTKKEAKELGGSVGVTRQLCEAAKKELVGLAHQLEAARLAYERLAPEVEKMEKRLASTTRAFDATKPELLALEAQLERARGLFDRTLQKIEAAKSLTGSGDFDVNLVRRRTETRLREMQFAKF